MMIEIVSAKTETYANLGRYFFAELRTEKQAIEISIGPREVRVCVKNGSHRAWRGLGRRFETLEAAKAGYKLSSVVAMIEEAGRLNAAAV